ncbi:MAG: neutral/alkaline non-lysosomal ceramidase N-terminal domain-containing protein [Candidatus Asgardarchaeia archaeon]
MGKLKVGVSKVNITPPMGIPLSGYFGRMDKPSIGVHDDLYAKCLVLDDGSQKVAIISADLLALDNDLVNSTRSEIEKLTGIPGENVMMAATHTHSGPIGTLITLDVLIPEKFKEMAENLRELYIRKFATLVHSALQNMKEGKVGSGKGKVCGACTNREDPNGPYDNEICILRTDDVSGNLIGVIVNFSCHPTILNERNLMISADFPHYTTRVIETVKEGSLALYMNGAQGNVSTRFTRRSASFKEAERIGNIVGGEALKVLEKIETIEDAEIEVKREVFKIPQKKFPTVDEAKAMVKEAEEKVKELGSRGVKGPYLRVAMNNLVGAKLQLYLAEHVKGPIFPEEAEVQAIRINDTVLVGIPGELFTEFQIEIKEKSKFEKTFVIALANGYVGYIFTPEAYEKRVYETFVSPLKKDSGYVIRDVALRLIGKMSF